jgi:hypothetical protein
MVALSFCRPFRNPCNFCGPFVPSLLPSQRDAGAGADVHASAARGRGVRAMLEFVPEVQIMTLSRRR